MRRRAGRCVERRLCSVRVGAVHPKKKLGCNGHCISVCVLFWRLGPIPLRSPHSGVYVACLSVREARSAKNPVTGCPPLSSEMGVRTDSSSPGASAILNVAWKFARRGAAGRAGGSESASSAAGRMRRRGFTSGTSFAAGRGARRRTAVQACQRDRPVRPDASQILCKAPRPPPATGCPPLPSCKTRRSGNNLTSAACVT
jgi:hypothetical protein